MERISERKRGNLYSDGKCAICFEELDETVKEQYYNEECDHVYHKQCIMEWEKSQEKVSDL